MEEYNLGRIARIKGESLERNPFDKSGWRYKEWQAGWLDHKHRMEDVAPKTMVQKVKIKGP